MRWCLALSVLVGLAVAEPSVDAVRQALPVERGLAVLVGREHSAQRALDMSMTTFPSWNYIGQ